MKKEELTLKPKDYIVLAGGLKIANVSKDNVITFDLLSSYTVCPMKHFKEEEKSAEIKSSPQKK